MPDAKCAGCDTTRAPLTLMSNGKHYCVRCAEEIEAMGWANPAEAIKVIQERGER